MSRNGHSVEHDVERLKERVDSHQNHISNIELDNKHTRATLGDVRGEVKEMRGELKSLRILAERAIGGAIAIGLVWTVVTFVVALLFRR